MISSAAIDLYVVNEKEWGGWEGGWRGGGGGGALDSAFLGRWGGVIPVVFSPLIIDGFFLLFLFKYRNERGGYF